MKINKIYNENCLETMARMPENFIDLTVTSPPYDDLREYNGYLFEFEKIAKELFRVTKAGGVVVWVVGDKTENGSESLSSFKQAIYFVEYCGFNLHDTMIWQRPTIPQCGVGQNRYEQEFEYMFVFSKRPPKVFNPIKSPRKWQDNRKVKVMHRDENGNFKIGGVGNSPTVKIGNIWNIPNHGGFNDSIAYLHPAIFAEKMVGRHIMTWSNEGDLIYDPMGGSGTVAKMAIIYKRNWIMSEISAEYCEIAEKRIKPHLQQISLAI
jgi:site-specific DNA-methyltransferase (adenine-specific)